MDGATKCQSCGMPIEDGSYCVHCTDEAGNLQTFDERFARMVQWMLRQEKAASREQAEKLTLEYMATMPAWKNHPKLKQANQ